MCDISFTRLASSSRLYKARGRRPVDVSELLGTGSRVRPTPSVRVHTSLSIKARTCCVHLTCMYQIASDSPRSAGRSGFKSIALSAAHRLIWPRVQITSTAKITYCLRACSGLCSAKLDSFLNRCKRRLGFCDNAVPTISDIFLVMLMTRYLKRFWKIAIMFCTHIYRKTSVNTVITVNRDYISCACCTRTVISLLLYPNNHMFVFAILETFILLSVLLLLCTSFRLILYFIS